MSDWQEQRRRQDEARRAEVRALPALQVRHRAAIAAVHEGDVRALDHDLGGPWERWGVNDGGRADRISKVGDYPAHVRPGSGGHRLPQAGGSAACRPGPGQQWDNEIQLDSAGLDGT